MLLPGGLFEGGTRSRHWSFKPVSGRLELALCEAAETGSNTPRAVTQVLRLALAHLGERPVTEARVANLCVGDRQFLMRELEQHLGRSGGWFHADCTTCANRFDFSLQYADLPVQEAGPSYPLVRVQWQDRQICFRLPTGADQEQILEQPQPEATSWLLHQLLEEPECVLPCDNGFQSVVDAALEEVAPGIVTRVLTSCPECEAENTVELDPYRLLAWKSDGLLKEIHQLASHYHWSEAEILALPRFRRQRYLDLIDQSRGMIQ
ncbi:hypothetical protein JWJ90_02555 [Desulfobulbus rhabdoformis]|uniref:hypothetical protein n=1 Tax=Desulfobulbus rhabdoformis TaxID=34032 RepID=UPI0019666A2B|nr:hypothetical protein [Desulfobulbus rhabdoformis]MBM9613162.1 hypothetical protein [Desulfobulbus rhabdoformis]